jgi:putative endonuclease
MSRAAGDLAESLAASFLEQRGHRVLERNVTCRLGELDLVTLAPGGTVCFVEVRARRAGTRFGAAAETVGPRKQRKLILAARFYLARRRGPLPPCRFDVIEVQDGRIHHIVDAFRLPDGS